MRSTSLNVGWMHQLVGSLSVYADAPFFAVIANGSCICQKASFLVEGDEGW